MSEQTVADKMYEYYLAEVKARWSEVEQSAILSDVVYARCMQSKDVIASLVEWYIDSLDPQTILEDVADALNRKEIEL